MTDFDRSRKKARIAHRYELLEARETADQKRDFALHLIDQHQAISLANRLLDSREDAKYFVSDSSMSKTVHGCISEVERSKTGIRVILTNGKTFNWRLNAKMADLVYRYTYPHLPNWHLTET